MNDLVRRLREYGRPVALLDWLDTTPYATEVSVSSFKISPEAEWEKVFAEAESRLPNYRKNITSFFQGQFDRFRRAFHELSVPELEQIREWATKHTGQRFVVKLAAEWSAPLFDFEDSVPVPDRVRLAQTSHHCRLTMLVSLLALREIGMCGCMPTEQEWKLTAEWHDFIYVIYGSLCGALITGDERTQRPLYDALKLVSRQMAARLFEKHSD